MFNGNWVDGKSVNGQSFDYQYALAEAYWTAEVTFKADASYLINAETLWYGEATAFFNPTLTGGMSAQWNAIATLSDTSVLQTQLIAEASWQVVTTTTWTGNKQIEAKCEWVGLSNSTFTGGGIVSVIAAPPHRCFKVGPYKAQFYVDDLYRDAA